MTYIDENGNPIQETDEDEQEEEELQNKDCIYEAHSDSRTRTTEHRTKRQI